MGHGSTLIRIGIIGAGRIVEKVHIPTIRKLKDLNIAIHSVFDIDRNRALKIGSQNEIPNIPYTSDELIKDSDVILIASPNTSHYKYIMAGIRAGKHLICEKPFITDLRHINEISTLNKSNKKNLFICFNNRHRPEIIRMREIIKQSTIGTILEMKIGWVRRRGIPGIGSCATVKEQSGGGVLIDLGSHMIDLLVWLLSPDHSSSITASCKIHCLKNEIIDSVAEWYGNETRGTTTPVHSIEHTAWSQMKIGPTFIEMNLSWVNPELERDKTYIYVKGTKGFAHLETLFGLSNDGIRPMQPLTVFLNETTETIKDDFFESTDPIDSYKRQFLHFFKHLMSGEKAINMFDEGILNLKIIKALYKAAKKEATIKFRLDNY